MSRRGEIAVICPSFSDYILKSLNTIKEEAIAFFTVGSFDCIALIMVRFSQR